MTDTKSLTLREISERFFKIEQNLNLFDQKIENVYFWERIRFQIHRKILCSLGIIGEAHDNIRPSLIGKFSYCFLLIKGLLCNNPFFSRPAKLLFLGHKRRKIWDGLWWDIYCDCMLDRLKKGSYIYLAGRYQHRYQKPCKTRDIQHLDVVTLLAFFLRKFMLCRINLTEKEKELTEAIRNTMRKEFGCDINVSEYVKNNLSGRKSQYFAYRLLLRKLRPEFVFLIVSYGNETFIEACKKLKIPIAEIQHGIISRYHLGYSFSQGEFIKKTFPDYFFAFGDYWKDTVKLPLKRENIFSVGYPFLEEAKRYKNVEKKDWVLFLSQGSVGTCLSKLAVELSQQKDFKRRIFYKLHPGEYMRWKSEYPWLLENKDSINVIEEAPPSIYKLMAASKAQIGCCSTSIYEGLVFGLKTYLVDFPGIEYMDYLLANNYAVKISTVNELIERLKSNKTFNTIDKEYFFKNEPIYNFSKVLADLGVKGVFCEG